MSVNTDFENLNITTEEFEKLTIALKKEEFRKLFLDYCEEIQDPKNRKQYEDEIKQLEAERGVDVTFLNPEPGFVLETSLNGDLKCFLNIAACEKINPPTSEKGKNPQNGEKGVNWSIPHAIAPPRPDVDEKNCRCQVYDVILHPKALTLAQNNEHFKKCLIDTACDGIEREFKVRLDRINLLSSTVKFKGIQRSTVIRKLSENGPLHSEDEPSPLDDIYPPKPAPAREPTQEFTTTTPTRIDEYCKPKYVLKHRRPVDMSEMTYELDAKMNITIPKELVIEIELPLLNSAANSTLDITDRRLYFTSENPAKYKLNIELPYDVNEKEGCAKFDSDKHKLLVTLPVKAFKKERTIHDFNREDSGVESDIRDDSCHGGSIVSNIPEIDLESEKKVTVTESKPKTALVNSKSSSDFLKKSIKYKFPQHFDLNILDETIAIVLHVKNVDNESIKIIKDAKFFHMQFESLGTGFYPTHYTFYFEFAEQSAAQIDSVDAEAWDNNVVLNIKLKEFQNIEYYYAGSDSSNVKMFTIQDEFILANSKQPKTDDKQSKLEVSVELLNNEKSIQIEIKPKKAEEESKRCSLSSKNFNKKGRKPNKKHRSYSESTCDDIKQQNKQSAAAPAYKINHKHNNNNTKLNGNSKSSENNDTIENRENASTGGGEIQIPFNRKQRSSSESRNQSAPSYKGILKHNSRYLRTMSDSCSSFDDNSYSCSIDGDMKLSHSFSDIPEENNSSQHGLSESCKKTVRFSDVIKKNVFRLDSSILGRRKINQKKKNKKRALQRRHSEGDSADYEDNKLSSNNNNNHFLKRSENERKSSKHDSGLDLSTQSKQTNNNGSCLMRHRIESESSDLDSKNSLMFDMDI